MTGAAKRIVLEVLGWVLLLAGIAAMVLPGPGLLLMAAGLAVLSQQYTWAERLLDPVLLRALRAAAEGVETWPRIVASTIGALGIGAFGLVWLLDPDTPDWWPIAERWWLPGGVWTGVTLLLSCAIALGLLVYSYRRFHGKPEARAALEGEITEADDRRHHTDEHER
ncbi:PGPGW domain-containing protein [Nocardioides daeguensis]|uniref:PGPGW domain-containing protein n=1 Tax=Nocardioides daeguensis TaxID=908359 RepID=UPI001C47C34A|nr:PGPGW domain-containing protein [Nocardioides daeguensis]MBV6726542.1 PGPGW domain-containing protein [Nocardioides daeguensis]MCR1772385.1 PGPGW domain-containing protein [Nocardioides daeguensis]